MSVRQRFFLESLAGVVFGLFIYIFVLAISKENSKPIDVTNNQRFTLSDQTEKAVKDLKGPTKIWAFADDKSRPAVEELLTRYKRLNANLSFEILNPHRSPKLAAEMDVHQAGVAIVEAEGTAGEAPKPTATASASPVDGKDKADTTPKNRRERANAISEEELTNAILKLDRHAEVKIYALSGHGEREADGTDEMGLGQFKAALSKEGFVLQSLNFAKDKSIPADCSVLIIAGPKSPLLPKEDEMLRAYLKNNGRIFLMLEPESPEQFVKLAGDYGIDCPNQVILDPVSAQLNAEPVFAIGYEYNHTHPITKDFKQNTIFQLARPILVGKNPPAGAQVVVLASTAQYAFTLPASEIMGQKTIKIEEGKYPPAVQSLAVAGNYPNESATPSPTPAVTPTPGATPEPKKAPQSRLVVVGDADFLCNASFKLLGGRDFSLNIVNWLAESENQISIRSKDAEGTPIRLTETELRNQSLFQCLIVPLAIATMGIFLVWRRR